VVRSVKHKLFRTLATEIMSIPLARIREMKITSDLSAYFDAAPLPSSSYVFKIIGSGLKKRNLYFVVLYRRDDGSETRMIFGADYPGPSQTNVEFLRKLISTVASWEKNNA
jgi:hypothetical protein